MTKDTRISGILCRWYSEHKRDLPWRHTHDPYKIWLSEIILQQTRVSQGLSYYIDFTTSFPDVYALAAAKEDEVLKHWQGLGYYSRARNMHQAAQTIVEKFQGKFPDTFEDLISLKGIGHYTAAAIASFAYQLPYPVLDGNVYRVLARLYDIDVNIFDKEAPGLFYALAMSALDENNPAIHNQAIMEFGALQCKPQQPDCPNCPAADICLAYAANEVENRPVRINKSTKKTRFFYYICPYDGEHIWLQQRKGKDIWQHLWEFPLIEGTGPLDWPQLLKEYPQIKEWLDNDAVIYPERAFRHQLTHQIINAFFFPVRIKEENGRFPSGWEKISICDTDKYAVSRLTDKYLDSLDDFLIK